MHVDEGSCLVCGALPLCQKHARLSLFAHRLLIVLRAYGVVTSCHPNSKLVRTVSVSVSVSVRALWTTHATSCFLPGTLWWPVFPSALSDLRFSFETIHIGSSDSSSQSITHHGSGACVTESMSVLTDPATYGKLNSELTNCPRTAAVLGELAAQWQQTMGTLQRVEQEAVSSQSLANAIESIGRTRTEATAGRLRLKDGERLYPKSWSGSTPIGGFARDVAAWLGYIDPTGGWES